MRVGDLTKTDISARPQDNLYLAVNSKWQKDAKIPADRTEIGVNTDIDMKIEKKLMHDFDQIASGKEKCQTLRTLTKQLLYQIAKNFKKRDQDGAEPIKTDLNKLIALKDFAEFNKEAVKIDEFAGLPFGFDVEADMKNTKVHVLEFSGPGTFLPDTTSYQQDDAKKLLEILKKQTIKLLTMAGVDEAKAENYVDQALNSMLNLPKLLNLLKSGRIIQLHIIHIQCPTFEAKFKSFDMKGSLKNLFLSCQIV